MSYNGVELDGANGGVASLINRSCSGVSAIGMIGSILFLCGSFIKFSLHVRQWAALG